MPRLQSPETKVRRLLHEVKVLRRSLSEAQRERDLLRFRLTKAEKERDAARIEIFKWEARYDTLAKHLLKDLQKGEQS